MINVVGKTENGELVVAGVFKLYDTCGLPLQTVFEQCVENKWIPSWLHFYTEAHRAGWKDKTIFLRLTDAITDIYGQEYCDVVINRLKTL